MSWHEGVVVGLRDETPTARTLVLRVPGWPGHLPGQHVDVRLTAPDGYSAARSYSIGSAPDGETVELTIERLADGEVSPYLTRDVAVGDELDLQGPLGGWFVWTPSQRPVQLLGGGSGVVPLMAMVRTHASLADPPVMRLLHSVRDEGSALFGEELADRAGGQERFDVDVVYTRTAPPGSSFRVGRVDAEIISRLSLTVEQEPDCFVCGPTPFVEHVANLLVESGHAPARIRTERFGATIGT